MKNYNNKLSFNGTSAIEYIFGFLAVELVPNNFEVQFWILIAWDLVLRFKLWKLFANLFGSQ